jgi:hypothetical protein
MKEIPFIFRVIREKVDGQTVRILLEPYSGDQVVDIQENDEYITGKLHTDPWEESRG